MTVRKNVTGPSLSKDYASELEKKEEEKAWHMYIIQILNEN